MAHRVFKEMAVGRIGVQEEDGKIIYVFLHDAKIPSTQADAQETPVIRQAFRELEEYFAGERKVFTVPLGPRGTAFRMRVWRELCKVKYGETMTYGELAKRVGSPNAARAVGGAMHNNPLSIFYPCHRVIGANGSLTGFGGGLALKEKLLKLEGITGHGRRCAFALSNP